MAAHDRVALITGASSGIGAAFADVFASAGFALVITARREARLRALAERLRRDRGVRVDVVSCDLAAPGAAAMLCAEIERRGLAIDALVNNAGFGAPGGFTGSSWDVHEDMLDVMVVAASELTYRLLPGMIARRYGRIVNVASVGGLVDAGAGTLYGAAKSYLIKFSASLSREMAPHGIYVTAVCPGATRTEFHDAPGMRETVKGMPRWMWMEPAAVAQQGFDAVMAGKRLSVNGGVNRALVAVLRYVPRSLLAALARLDTRLRRARSTTTPPGPPRQYEAALGAPPARDYGDHGDRARGR